MIQVDLFLLHRQFIILILYFFFLICFSLFSLRWIDEEAVRVRLCMCVMRYVPVN